MAEIQSYPPCGCARAAGGQVGADRLERTHIPLRQAWFRRLGPAVDYEPPLPALLRSAGRDGARGRLRLWFWLYLAADVATRGGDPPVVHLRRRDLAIRLHFLDPANGNQKVRVQRARRVDAALQALVHRRLVERVASAPDQVRLLAHDGSGRPYQPESSEQLEARLNRHAELMSTMPHRGEAMRYDAIHRPADPDEISQWALKRQLESGHVRLLADGRRLHDAWESEPIQLPATLWSNGWISELPASALCVLLALFDQAHHGRGVEEVTVPKIRSSQYTIRPDSWRAGIAALREHGLVTDVLRRPAGALTYHSYSVDFDQITTHRLCPPS